jgi:hypothetical protein
MLTRARRRARSVLAIALVGLLATTATGCAKKPTMTLRHANVSGVQVAFPPSVGIVMNVVMDVYNPNSYDVAVRAVRGTVVFANRYSLPIDFRAPGEGVWLPADATTAMQVPISVPVDLALTLLRESQMSYQIPFRMTGRADVTATRTFKIEKDDYSVDEVGTISRAQVEQTMRSVLPWGR